MAVAGDGVMDRLAALVAVDLDALSSPRELQSVLRQSASVRAWLDAFDTRAAERAARMADAGSGPGAVEGRAARCWNIGA